MRNLSVLACVAVFMMCACMTCEDNGPELHFANASDYPVRVKCHRTYNDSIPDWNVPPGATVKIDYEMWFDNYRVVYVSVYGCPDAAPKPADPWRPGANNPARSDASEKLPLLKRYELSRRFLEAHDWMIIYGDMD